MKSILFKNESEISNDWLFYIENEAKSLSQREEFAIENYIDRELFNPEMENYLSTVGDSEMRNSDRNVIPLQLNLVQGIKANILPQWLNPNFHNLKKKIKQIFCGVVQSVGDLDTKGILKMILVALIPAFAGGIPAIALPIIIGLLAYLIKFGIEKTCPH